MRAQSDERLVDLVRAGNATAFDAIVARYRLALLRYCEQIAPGDRAEDVVQQTLLKAYDALRASNGEMHLRAWLYRIAHNTALNALRDRSLSNVELDETIDGVERPDQAFARREELRGVMTAVKGLPDGQRNAIVLRELEGRSYEEIAESLGVTDGSVRMLLNRARTSVRAGITAVTPYGLLARTAVEADGHSATARIAELTAGTGSALALKAAATVLVTGAVVGGGAIVKDSQDSQLDGPAAAEAAEVPATRAGGPTGRSGDGGRRAGRRQGRPEGRRGRPSDRSRSGSGPDGRRGAPGRSGPGVGDDASGPGGDDHSPSQLADGHGESGPSGGSQHPAGEDRGSVSGSGSGSGSSGPGGGDEAVGSDSSGPGGDGSSGSGSSGSGSGGDEAQRAPVEDAR